MPATMSLGSTAATKTLLPTTGLQYCQLVRFALAIRRKVEKAVQEVERQILARLRHQSFQSSQ